jgi:tetratricopeptide (TPR) repeat protein
LAGPDRAKWHDRLEREFDNLAAALDWLLLSQRVADALRAMSALERFWPAHAHVSEARRWLAVGIELGDAVPTDVRAAALRTAALQAAAQSDWPLARTMFAEALALFRAGEQATDVLLALAYLSFYARMEGDMTAAERTAREAVSIAANLDDDRARSAAATVLGDVYSAVGQHDLAVAQYEEAVRLRVRFGDPLLVMDAIYNLGMVAFHASERARARDAFADALVQARELGEIRYVAAAQLMLAELDLVDGEGSLAAQRVRESLALYTDLDDDRSRARCLVVLAATAVLEGSYEAAARMLGAADAARGGDSLDEFEAPVLERYLPELEAQLGLDAVAALTSEGRAMSRRALATVVVSETQA